MTVEALRAARELAKLNVEAEVVDLRTIKPLDSETVITSAKKTGHLLVVDSGWASFGVAAEVLARVAESGLKLKSAPRRVTLPDMPTPSAPSLTKNFYPDFSTVVEQSLAMLGRSAEDYKSPRMREMAHDVPDKSFTGPF